MRKLDTNEIKFLISVGEIDAASVVRCKDCVYAQSAKINKKGYRICPASHMEITDDDFCSYGERRAENENHA